MGYTNVDLPKDDKRNTDLKETLAFYNIERFELPATRITPNIKTSILLTGFAQNFLAKVSLPK